MKIAVAGQNYHIKGGSDKVLMDEQNLLRSYGHEVAPFCGSDPKNEDTRWEEFFPRRDVSLSSPRLQDVCRYVYNNDAKKAVRRFISAFRPDIFHCHIYYGKLSASILGEIKDSGIPLVQTIHEYKTVCPTYQLISNEQVCEKCSGFAYYNVLFNRCNRNSVLRSAVSMVESYASYFLGSISKIDRFIAVSNFQRQKVVEMGVPKDKVVTIYNFIDADSCSPTYETGRYFLYFGRIEKTKGIWSLIRAFEKLKTITLLVVGTGNEYSAVTSYCELQQITNVKFFGFANRAQLNDLIKGAVATIVPSVWYETFGLSAAESLAHGKPVIAADIGGLPEVLSPGEDSILFEPGNVDQLSLAVVDLAMNKQRAVDMGMAGRRNVKAKFNKAKHYEELVAVYQSLT